MEIGGYDTIYETAEPTRLLLAIMIALGWSAPVTEWINDRELFFYRDQAARDAWDRDVGPDETMVYFIVDPGRLTVVSDEVLTAAIRVRFLSFLVPS
jgi:hypothetical protein